jgi:hypothetical protein
MEKVAEDELLRVWMSYGRNAYQTAKHLGLDPSSCARRLRRIQKRGRDVEGFEIDKPPPDELPIDDLLEIRKKRFERKRRHEDGRRLINVRLDEPLPYGILHFGDPHVDDDGTDIAMLERHSDLTRTVPGLYGANVGDTTNNWVGRLAKLYGQQGTSAKEAWQLAEWFIRRTRWLYLVGGNHDAWSGDADPLRWMVANMDAIYQDSEVRLQITTPAKRPLVVNARHDFAGSSQYNPAHGPMKAVHFGVRDHIAVCGHKHISGYGVIKDPTSGRTCHALQVASYKVYDRYARERGFRDQSISACAVTIVNTTLEETNGDFVKVFWDAEEGAAYLTDLRSREKKDG